MPLMLGASYDRAEFPGGHSGSGTSKPGQDFNEGAADHGGVVLCQVILEGGTNAGGGCDEFSAFLLTLDFRGRQPGRFSGGPAGANVLIISPVMSKKAGPKRIDPETFLPIVFTAQGTDTSLLVCRRRWIRVSPVLGGPPEALFNNYFFAHPVAIQFSPTVEVLTGFEVRDGTWVTTRSEDFGISERCAKVALAEAWHAVKVTVDSGTMSGHISSRLDAWLAYKNGVRMRNLITALFWDHWNREVFTSGDRIAALASAGIQCTQRQLEKFATEHGFPKNSA